jgi:hypothetical protein
VLANVEALLTGAGSGAGMTGRAVIRRLLHAAQDLSKTMLE